MRKRLTILKRPSYAAATYQPLKSETRATMMRFLTTFGCVLCVCFGVMPTKLPAQGVRKLAPGVLTVIPPETVNEETFEGPLALTKVTAPWKPSFSPETETLSSKAAAVTLRHNIWGLEFAFKPLRMVAVDIPQPTGKMQRKLIWYLVYRVRNLGGHLVPVKEADATYKPQPADEVFNIGAAERKRSIRFFPHVVLECRELGKSYLDRVIPAAIPVISQRELRGAKLYSSVGISSVPIPVTAPEDQAGTWAVLTWEDVDPRVDFFSLYIQGLTNAFKLSKDAQGQVQHLQKTLQLNFWRPGDTIYENEKEIRFGVPLVTDAVEQAAILSKYGQQEPLDHRWVYR